ncbi:MAG: 4Fe-4S dicluster domain-containing protein [Anaerolineae bacterium]|nr:4Fe-4S dicluster domain-containing protein [Anaerolineae bacterium]
MASTATYSRVPTFFDEVVEATPGETHLELCLQCGTCGGSCPSGADMDHTPRAIFAMIEAGMRQEVLSSNMPWYCVSCYYCMVRCPQEIHITDIMYTLKRMSLHEGAYKHSSTPSAPKFSKIFIDFVENFGRSFEVGLMALYNMRYRPFTLPKLAPMGLGLVSKGRLEFVPKRIKNLGQLKAILAKAKEISASSVANAASAGGIE